MNTRLCPICGVKYWNSPPEPHCEACLLAKLAWFRANDVDKDVGILLDKARSAGRPIRLKEMDANSTVYDSDRASLDRLKQLDIFYKDRK